MKIAKQLYCLWRLLYFVNEQQGFTFIGDNIFEQVNGIEDVGNRIRLFENGTIGLLFQVEAKKNFEFTCERIDQSSLAHLSRPPQQ